MIRYKHVSVSGSNAIQTLVDAMVGVEGRVKHVTGVYVHEVTAALQNNARIEVWVEQEQIADVDIRQFNDNAATPLLTAPIYIPLDLKLESGKTLSLGHTSGATASDLIFTIAYRVGSA